MAIEYEEIRNATTNFGRDMVLEDGKFGTVYKGWIDEHYAGVKPGSGISVTVKKLKNEWPYIFSSYEGWMVGVSSPNYFSSVKCFYQPFI